MKQLKWVIWLALLLQQEWITAAQKQQTTSSKTQSSIVQLYDSNREEAAAPPPESTLGSIYRKSRQSRCVRCYEDRQSDDRSRYYGSSGSGYSSRSADNWYYPYDRYDDRYRSEDRYRPEDRYRQDYDRYSASYSAGSSYYRDRDDRLGAPTYDRYEGRGGHDRYDRRGGYEQDRYSDYYRDRSYERPRGGSYDRDYYDRSSSSRYDYRNYRPYDETYRGQSGFDNSGRGYYFAAEESDRRRYPSKSSYDERGSSSPCGVQVRDCPYASGGGGGYSDTTQVSSRPINSQRGYGYGYSYSVANGGNGSGSDAGAATRNTSANNSNNNTSQNQGWSYVDDRNKESSTRGNGRDGNRGREREGERERDRGGDQQSNSYSGRPPRPLGGSYLFDRDSNALGDEKTTDNAADKDNNGDVKANGVSNISSSANAGQDKDITNGGGGGVDGVDSIQMQTIVRDK